uniref:Toll/interleukin-1 receptor (TIR) domain-containing protein n=1 Tax=Tanacetum cinerariifolium TaxID=118510 RepID=A0A6L2L0E5_TANCI|nr:Toll/interleukin-1 receptor (TIR) domain-containing protein [Tanacetum cinerariifolium]
MDVRIKAILSSLEMGGVGKTTLAIHFEGKSFVENVREVSKASLSGLKKLQKQIVSNVLNKQDITIGSVHNGTNMMKKMMCGRKVLIVLDDVDNIDQLEVLAGEPNWYAIRRENLIQGYEELSEVVQYADGLPLAIKVLGSFLCGQNEPQWIDALQRLKTVPLKATMEILELSYDDTIRALESRGFHARIGLRVLELKSLITISYHGYLGMHDHKEEMGRDIVHRLHPDEPNRHSRLWNCKEIEDILVNESDHRFLDVYYKRHVYSGSNGKCNEVRRCLPMALLFLRCQVEESVALKELRLNTLRFMQRLICRDGEKGENYLSLCVLAMKAWLGLGRYGGTEKDLEVSTRAAIRVVQRVVGDCVNGEGFRVRVKLVGEFVSNSNIVALFFSLKSRLQSNGLACKETSLETVGYSLSLEMVADLCTLAV